ncbi:MAG: hypothetical protein OHK0053_06540 [Microscillaceae bacterium]
MGLAGALWLLEPSLGRHWWGKHSDARTRGRNDFGVPVPGNFNILGIDVSRYQGEIDWPEVRKMRLGADSLTFVFIKATEGDSLRDRFFLYNWQMARSQGLRRGAYHFYDPNINSRRQAANFIQAVALEAGDLPPVLDIERTGKFSPANLRLGLKRWLREIENYYGCRAIIYTNQHFYQKYLLGHFPDYVFWIARYGQVPPEVATRWQFWQYSDQGLVNGIVGKVDLNVFKGGKSAFEKLLKTP